MFTNILGSIQLGKNIDLVSTPHLHSLRVRHLYENLTAALWANVVIAILAFVLLWNQISTTLLLIWTILLIIVTTVRYTCAKKYFTSEVKETQSQYWYIWFLSGLGSAGIVWGALIFLALQQENTLILQFSVLLVAGLCSGVAVSASASMFAYLCYIIPASLPGSIYLLTSGKQSYIFIGACLLFFSIFLTILEKRISNSTVNNLQLHNVSVQLYKCLQNFVKNVRQAVLILDPKKMVIVDVNDQACQLLDYDSSNLINLPVHDLFSEEDTELDYIDMLNRVEKNGESYSSNQKFLTKTGETLYLQTSLSTIPSNHGALILCAVHKSDTSEDNIATVKQIQQNEKITKETKLLVDIHKKDRSNIADTLYNAVNPKLLEILTETYHLSRKADSEEMEKHLNKILSLIRDIESMTRKIARRLKNTLYLAK